MSLLSPSESNAFQTFLSSLDYPDSESVSLSSAEWALYSANASMYSPHDDSETNPEHREALIKATKDLMSLDSDNWDTGASMMDHHSSGPQHQRQGYGVNGHSMAHYDQQERDRLLVHQQQVLQHQRQHRQQQQQQQQEQQRHNSFSTAHEIFPFLTEKGQHPQPPQLQYPMHPMQMRQQQQHPSVSPMNTISSDHSSPTSPHSPYVFHQRNSAMPMSMHQQHQQQQQQQLHIPQQQQTQSISASGSRNTRLSTSQSTPTGLTNASRPTTMQIPSSASNPNADASSSSHPNGFSNHNNIMNGRHLTNGVNGSAPPKRQRSSTSPPIPSQQEQQQSSGASKQTLLSPSQKKANHIQSEQKRRANIRRGYEALCETVPALREAIREEEEAERNTNHAARGGGNVNGVQRKKSRGKKNGKDGEEREKDRLDGRAGPRSENVVLSKTIDHIQSLISDRSSLLARLHRARSSLPPGHPALTPIMSDPPWEREWKGGDGRLGDEDPDGEGNGSEGEDGEDDVE